MSDLGDRAAETDWDAVTYDRVAEPMTRWGATVLERLSLNGDETVLDCGCGSGRVTEQLVDRLPAGRVVALDASPNMLDEARRRLAPAGDRVSFLQADLLQLTPAMLGADAPVDALFSTATFHWVQDHDRLFANLAAVVRPGGQLIAQCGAEGNLDHLLGVVRGLGVDRPGLWEYASPNDTRRRLETAGFEAIDVWTNEEPTAFEDPELLVNYLESVCLRQLVGTMSPPRLAVFLRTVVDAMPELVIDYVRLNISARRSR